MKAVTGDVPSNDPIDIEIASTQYATVDRSKSFVIGSTRPESLAMVYKVLDVGKVNAKSVRVSHSKSKYGTLLSWHS
jgi:hypothetical protein